MPMPCGREIGKFIKHPWIGIGFTLFLAVVAFRMNALISNLILVVAWVIFVICIFYLKEIKFKPLPDRFAWTVLSAFVFGFIFYFFLTPATIRPQQSNPSTPPIAPLMSAGSQTATSRTAPVTKISQSSNTTVKNNSDNIAVTGTNNQFSNQKFFGNFQGQMNFPANIGSLTINNPVYTNPPDTELRAWVTQVNETATFASNGILITTAQLSQLDKLLTKLDERTEDIQILPDGRTSLGGIVVGASRIMGGDRNAAILSFYRKDYHLAFQQSRKAIEDFESCPSNFIDEKITIAPVSKAVCYKVALLSAGFIGSNDLANEYAIKLVNIDPNSTNKMLLVLTLASLANQKHIENDYTDSFSLYQCAITNYESIKTNVPDLLTKENTIRLYVQSAQVAFQIGKTNEALEYSQKASEVFSKSTNTTNAP
jgi:hypothetical protein